MMEKGCSTKDRKQRQEFENSRRQEQNTMHGGTTQETGAGAADEKARKVAGIGHPVAGRRQHQREQHGWAVGRRGWTQSREADWTQGDDSYEISRQNGKSRKEGRGEAGMLAIEVCAQ
ncbi:hypothetical protein CDL15_Pgr018692 [Punica granatum]|uniref:Uncharacterized protein n=1 Tax=Punica granatum TaxID=22663 RepID=A0A218VVT2_PUNGR|nr:hypothetical protein CDL15_Pgr018692 [Punica granatum]